LQLQSSTFKNGTRRVEDFQFLDHAATIDNFPQVAQRAAPFTDFSPKWVEGIFSPEQVTQLAGVLDEIRARAGI